MSVNTAMPTLEASKRPRFHVPEKANKSRIITIRVSEEEYDNLRVATKCKGYRSVSEFARAAIQTVAGDQVAPHQALARLVDEHSSSLAVLSLKLERFMTSARQVWAKSKSTPSE